jgi:hypothetical protein
MPDEVDLREKAKEVDINDLQLADEQVTIDGDADAFAGPPPPPDGDHRAKLSVGKRKVTGGKDKRGRPFYMVDSNAKIIAGDFENRILFDNVSTMVMDSSGTSRMAGVLKALGEQVGGRTSIVELTRLYVNKLAGEPEVLVQSQWTAYCADCKADADASGGKRGKKNGIVLRGQKRFPQDANGGHRHQVECPNCGSMLSARAEIVAYKPIPAGS